MKIEWGRLAQVTGGRLVLGDPKVLVGPVTIDSRAVKPGDTFVALKGQRVDGHDFISEVLTRGAVGVIVSREVSVSPGTCCLQVADPLKALQDIGQEYRRLFSGHVIGITGSNGKTTTKDMVAHILRTAGKSVLSTRGNLNSQVGLPLMLTELDPSQSHAVLERGASAKGDIARLVDVSKPRVGVITNVGRAHLETFGSLEGVLEAKWEMVSTFPSDAVAVLNGDDPLLETRRRQLACSVISFGLSSRADVRGENVYQGPHTGFDLIVEGLRRSVRLPIPGLFNIYNALAAATVSWVEKIPLDTVVQALESFSSTPHRMQVKTRADGVVFVLDAYNANPTSMGCALESFAHAFPDRLTVAVLGGMYELGSQSHEEHRVLGQRLAAMKCGRVYFLGEEGEWVREGFPVESRESLFLFTDREALRSHLKKFLSLGTMSTETLSPGMAVFFKASRGVRLEEIYEPLLSVPLKNSNESHGGVL
jgi:UDP-N-acetylmuramoyl-tripeptide--D-alanyl-D-alanine ligase